MRSVMATSSAPASAHETLEQQRTTTTPLLWGPRLRGYLNQKNARKPMLSLRKARDDDSHLHRPTTLHHTAPPRSNTAISTGSYHPQAYPVNRYHVLHALHSGSDDERICPHTLVCSKNRRLMDATTFVAHDKTDDRHVLLTTIPKSAANLQQVHHIHRTMQSLSRGHGFQQLLHVWEHEDGEEASNVTPSWVFVQNFNLSWIPLDLFCEAQEFTEAKLRHVTFDIVSMVHFLHSHGLSASGQLCGSQDFMVNVDTNAIVWLVSPWLVLRGCVLVQATPGRCARDVTSIGYLMFHLTMVSHALALIASASDTAELELLVQTHLRHLSRPCRSMMLACLVENPTIEELIQRKWLRQVSFVSIVPKLDHHVALAQQHRCLVLSTLWSRLASFFTVDALGDMHNLAAIPSVSASLSLEEEDVESTRRSLKKQSTKRVYMGRHVSLHGHHSNSHQHGHSLVRAASVGGGGLLKRGMVIVPPLGSAMMPHTEDDTSDQLLTTTRSFPIAGDHVKMIPGSDDAIHDVGVQLGSQRSVYNAFEYAFPSSPSSTPEYDAFNDEEDEDDAEDGGDQDIDAPPTQRPRVDSLLMTENGHSSAHSLSDLKHVLRSLHHPAESSSPPSAPQHSQQSAKANHQTLAAAVHARASAQDAALDAVHLSAFGPRDIAFRDSFRLDIWAYLRQQRQEMLETARERNESEVAQRLQPLAIARGTLITVAIEPHGRFRVVGDDCQSFRWRGDVNGVSFELQRKNLRQDEDEEDEDALCIARIVAGTSVSLLFIRLRSQSDATTTDPSTMLLATRLEHVAADVREIPPQQLEPVRAIGRGAFGEAILARWTDRETDVVVKTPHSDPLVGGDGSADEFRHEAAVMQLLGKHPHVVELLGVTSSSSAANRMAIVTEYLPNGNVHDFLQRQESTVFARTVMARDVAHGLVNIHQAHVLHRDIAARNCLLDANFRVKVGDFGLSRVTNSNPLFFANDGFGPVKWMAPESVMPPHVFSTHSDAYMFGVLLYELWTGALPFSGVASRDAVALILEGKHVPIPSHLPASHRRLMERCFDPHPLARPTMDQILSTLDQWILHDTRAHTRVPVGIL